MAMPSSSRDVRLLDARLASRPFVPATLYRDYPWPLEEIEELWRRAREQSTQAAHRGGLAQLEHDHWDWRNKAAGVQDGRFVLVGVECESHPQGLMAVERLPRPGILGKLVVSVDYLESAPWNLRGTGVAPRFLGVGTVLIADAVRLSAEGGLDGRVGLHSLPQAERFYRNLGMTDHGTDPHYFDLRYFEFAGPVAEQWLASLGG